MILQFSNSLFVRNQRWRKINNGQNAGSAVGTELLHAVAADDGRKDAYHQRKVLVCLWDCVLN